MSRVMEFIGWAASALVGIGSLWVALPWLGDRLLRQLFAKELANHKNELAKALADHNIRLSKDLADHSARLASEQNRAMHQLQTESSLQLEHLRVNLQIDSYERQHTFELVQTRRVDALQELYRKWRNFAKSIRGVTAPLEHFGDIADSDWPALQEAWEEFIHFFYEHEVFFDEELVQSFTLLGAAVAQYFQDYLFSHDAHATLTEASAKAEIRDEMRALLKRMDNEIPPLLHDFQRAIRINMSNGPQWKWYQSPPSGLKTGRPEDDAGSRSV